MPVACLPLLCFVSGAQRIVVGGVDLGFLRLVGLVVLVRIISRGDFRGSKIQFADLLVFVFSFCPVLAAILRGQTDSIMMTLGLGFDIFSMYMLGRVYLATLKDWGVQIRALAWVSVPIAILFAIEGATRHNLFAVFGGVAEVTRIRDGQLRAQGAFAHPILAGAWFVAVIPLFLSQLKADANRLRGQAVAVCGTICAMIVILAVSSSTPIGGLVAIAVGYVFFPFRTSLQRIAIAAISLGILLHFVANDGLHGVLFTRATLVVGSTGDHRFNLYQAALDRIPEWFLFGVDSTAHWGDRLWDVTSEYIYNAVKGGILSLTLMIGLLYLGYRGIGRAMRGKGKRDIALLYGLGVSLFVHIVMFSAVPTLVRSFSCFIHSLEA